MDATGGDGGDSGIEAVAFVNPDNSVILVFGVWYLEDDEEDYKNYDENYDYGDDSGIETVAFVNLDDSVIVVFDDCDLTVFMIMMMKRKEDKRTFVFFSGRLMIIC